MQRAKLTPRKRPVQARSRATVDAIVEAAAYILIREGSSRLTTNRIADRAGVNVASLYQYFPSKEAILAELQRRHVAEQREAMRAVLEEHRGHDLETTVRALVSMGIAAHAVAPQIHAALAQALPMRRSRSGDDTDPVMRDVAQALVKSVPAGPDRALVLWVVETVSHAIIHSGIVERSGDVASGRLEGELIRLLLAYLAVPRE